MQGFIDGEGCFYVYAGQVMNRGRKILSVVPELELTQGTHAILLLEAINQFFRSQYNTDTGFLKPAFDIHSVNAAQQVRNVSRYILRDTTSIIQFIEKYPLLTRK